MNKITKNFPLSKEELEFLIISSENKITIDISEIENLAPIFIYISNLDLNIDIIFKNSQIKNILKLYLNSSIFIKIPAIEYMLANLLLMSKNISVFYYEKSIHSIDKNILKETLETLDDDLTGLLRKASNIIDSIYLPMLEAIDPNYPPLLMFKENSDESKEITPSIVRLLNLDGFLDFFIGGSTRDTARYYTHYFTKNIYDLENIFHYISNGKNLLFGALAKGFKDGKRT